MDILDKIRTELVWLGQWRIACRAVDHGVEIATDAYIRHIDTGSLPGLLDALRELPKNSSSLKVYAVLQRYTDQQETAPGDERFALCTLHQGTLMKREGAYTGRVQGCRISVTPQMVCVDGVTMAYGDAAADIYQSLERRHVAQESHPG